MSTHTPSLNTGPIIENLSVGAQLFIFSLRQWAIAARSKLCPNAALGPFYTRYKVDAALPILDEMMCHLSVTAFRPVELKCPCRADLGDDEFALLQVLRALQSDDAISASELLEQVMTPRFGVTFTRIARAYIAELEISGLAFTGVRYLTVVPKSAPLTEDSE